MIEMTLGEIAAAVGGAVADGDESVSVIAPAFVDSRAVEGGGLFVAIAGDRVDGHDFASSAVAAGAAGCLVEHPVGVAAVVVGDSVVALGRLAAHVIRRLDGCIVLGLTGSQGKTSTKDLLAQVLSSRGRTVATLGNANNEIGLPLTVLRAGADTEHLVLEMGARGAGHIGALCEIAPPRIGCVLNVGLAHVGEFGSREAIAAAKAELIESLPADGVAVLNVDDRLVAGMAARSPAPTLGFGKSDGADVRVTEMTLDDQGRPSFVLSYGGQSAPVTSQLMGEHQAANAAAAAAMAIATGMTVADVATALTAAAPISRWRMEQHERADGVLIVNDAYNANPDSMRAALETLAMVGAGRPDARTVAVLGEMRELGESADEEHEAIGRLAARLGISQLVVVGEPARALHLGASHERSWAGESVLVPDTRAATQWLRAYVRPGDVVLFKASRLVELERVAQALLDDDGHTAPGPIVEGNPIR